jgi:hypothetical protein
MLIEIRGNSQMIRPAVDHQLLGPDVEAEMAGRQAVAGDPAFDRTRSLGSNVPLLNCGEKGRFTHDLQFMRDHGLPFLETFPPDPPSNPFQLRSRGPLQTVSGESGCANRVEKNWNPPQVTVALERLTAD